MTMLLLDPNADGLRKLALGESAGFALEGYAVVFLGLLSLMCVLFISGAIFKAAAKRKAQKAVVEPPAAPVVEAVPAGTPAPGSAGEVKLFDVPDREAALIMAIVAEQMGKPLNELRFKSIKEVK